MELAALIVLIISAVVGCVAIFFTTFGTFIILAGAILFAWMTGFTVLSMRTVLVLITLYLCGEVLEYLCVIFGAKKLGASNAAVVGAIIGGFCGAVIGAAFLGIGLVLGTLFGIFFGAFIIEYIIQRDLVSSLKAGAGGVIGRVGSIIAKGVIAVMMLALIISCLQGYCVFL